jgi:hypothetical protein
MGKPIVDNPVYKICERVAEVTALRHAFGRGRGRARSQRADVPVVAERARARLQRLRAEYFLAAPSPTEDRSECYYLNAARSVRINSSL